LKLDLLLAQYLYTNKQLDLPGIGHFMLEETAFPDPEQIKQGKLINPVNLSFKSNTAIKDNPGLIEFISSQTGKIKGLAAADLDSHLSLAQQFLNIGNPFLFEGIGSLVKVKSGEYMLASAAGMPDNIKEYSSREISATSTSEGTFTGYKNILYPDKEKASWRKPAVIILAAAGIALAIWGGYAVYKMTAVKNKTASEPDKKKEEPVSIKDPVPDQKDSVVATTPNISPGNFRFVLETAKAKRAFERFGRLKTFLWNVQMDTKDSVTYKLFMLLPASAADTSHIIDSLTLLSGRKVFIEQ
jgi:hypothetical protein